MGMAIKSDMGESGFDIWNDWSQQSPVYSPRDARTTWKSINATGGVTLATLFYEAKQNGWASTEKFVPPTADQLEAQRKHRLEREQKERAETEQEQAQAKTHAKALCDAAYPANSDHPYLQRKAVRPSATLKEIEQAQAEQILGYAPRAAGEPLKGRLLVVPIKRGREIATVELIDESGRKAGLYGRGTRTGGYWATRRLPDGEGRDTTILIGEGVATVLSATEAVDTTGVAALSAHNVGNVTRIIRQQYPYADLVVLADVRKADGSPDPKAVRAAVENNARLAVPQFGHDRAPEQTDFNDMAQCTSRADVARTINDSLVPNDKDGTAAAVGPVAQLVRASDLTPEAVDWIWDGWLAAGKMHVLGGAPGTGKTTIAMALAATVSVGGRWPDGTRAEAGNVVIWSGEDDLKDTLVPRLLACGADTNRVHFVSGVINDGRVVSFDPATHMAALKNQLRHIGGVKLLIVDPVVSAVGGDDHKNGSVRRGLQPLVDLAMQEHCAVLGITHFTKGTAGKDPLERITGSLAFGALARLVMVAAKHQEQTDDGQTKRILCRAKSNLGPDDGGFEYDLSQNELDEHPGVFASHVLWGHKIDGGARDILAAADATADDDDAGSTQEEAMQFLRDTLADGPVPVNQINRDAEGAGFSRATIRRAQKKLGIKAQKEGSHNSGKPSRWVWAIPNFGHQSTVSDDQKAKVLTPSEEKAKALTPEHLSFSQHSCGFARGLEAKALTPTSMSTFAQNDAEKAKMLNTPNMSTLDPKSAGDPHKQRAERRCSPPLEAEHLSPPLSTLAFRGSETGWDDDSEDL
jgi:putative DNA primase/helicase